MRRSLVLRIHLLGYVMLGACVESAPPPAANHAASLSEARGAASSPLARSKNKARRAASVRSGASGAGTSRQPPNISTWAPAVRDLYRRARTLAGSRRGELLTAMRALGEQGAAADPALAAMTWDREVSETHRAMAGVLYAGLHAYDPPVLEQLLMGENAFGAKEAATLLARLGGKRAQRALERAVSSGPPGVRQLAARKLGELNRVPLAEGARRALHVLLTSTDGERVKWAATILTVDFAKQAERPLVRLLRHSSSSKAVQMQAAIALGKIADSDLAKLARYCQLGQHAYLRYVAAGLLLSKHGAKGRRMLESLVKPGDPLAARFRQLLAAPVGAGGTGTKRPTGKRGK